jgi:hypothetical protein
MRFDNLPENRRRGVKKELPMIRTLVPEITENAVALHVNWFLKQLSAKCPKTE